MLVPLPCSDVKCIALLQISSQDKEMLDMLQMLQWILVWSTYISDELRVVISCGLKLLPSLSWDALLFYARLKKLKARMYSISVVVGFFFRIFLSMPALAGLAGFCSAVNLLLPTL